MSAMPAVPVMGVIDATTASRMPARPSTAASTEQRPTRDHRATSAATGGDTGEP